MRGWKYKCGNLWISVLNAKRALYAVYVYIHPPQPLTGKSYTTENKVTTVSYFSKFQKGENDRIWKQNVYIAKKTQQNNNNIFHQSGNRAVALWCNVHSA